MSAVSGMQTGKSRTSRLKNFFIVLFGLVVGQFILHGPSLVGKKILLPLDILAVPGVYLPQTPEIARITPHNRTLADLVTIGEMSRRFAVSEIHAGRWPMWAPYEYAGVPVTSSKYSPFVLLTYLVASPVILAWKEMLAAIVAGLGFYLFCRRALQLGFWPSTFGAWCYPLTAFFVFWQGFTLGLPVVCLPWLLLVIDKTIRRYSSYSLLQVGLLTALVLVSGALDVAGQVLLVSGLFAIWSLIDSARSAGSRRQIARGILTLVAGWMLGFMMASPYLWPLLEYSRTGARMERRSGGAEERPPVGVAALPEVLLPDIYGSTEQGSLSIAPVKQSNLQESASAAYTGVLATLFLAPLAWCSRRHRSFNVFMVCLAFFGLSWCLNVPGLVQLLRLPGLNMMSHNRLVFAVCFAILTLAAIGLDVLWQERPARRWWFLLWAALAGCVSVWCFWRADALPDPLATNLAAAVMEGQDVGGVHTLEGVRQVQAWFVRAYTVAGCWSGVTFIAWLCLLFWRQWQRWLLVVFGLIAMGDLAWFGFGRTAQCDPVLYYPRINALEQVGKATPGRVIGYKCLPAPLSESHGLADIRGYDAVDPARLLDILSGAEAADSVEFSYARLQNFVPKITADLPDRIRVSPILDMLGVRYLILRQAPKAPFRAVFESDDYWVVENTAALPRAYVPTHVEVKPNREERLEKLTTPQFNPREVAYVEEPIVLPSTCSGTARIVSEVPTRITVETKMETPGLVVLADLWDVGWKAYLDGRSVPILRANHAVRGVVVPSGVSTVAFRYEPESLARGLRLMGVALCFLLLWTGFWGWRRKVNSGKNAV